MTNDRWGKAMVATLAVILTAALAIAVTAVVQQRAQQRLAVSRGLILRAAALQPADPVTALRLGIAAMRIHAEPQVRAALQAILASGRRIGTFTDDAGTIRGLAFSPDGRNVATATDEPERAAGLTALWELTDPARPNRVAILIVALPGHTAGVSTVAFTPDGHGVVNGIDGGTAELWDVTDRRSPRRTSVFTDPGLEPAAFSPDRRTLAAYRDETVELWDLTDWPASRRAATLTGGPVRGLAFSPDGQSLATVDGTTAFGLWNITDRAAPRRTATVAVNVEALVFGPDGHTIATVDSSSGESALWDVSDRTAPRRVAHFTGAVDAMAFSPDERSFATVENGGIVLWDITDLAAPRRSATLPGRGSRSGPGLLAFSPDGRTLLVAGEDGVVEIRGVSRVADVVTDPVGEACRIAGIGLTRSEWSAYVPELPYRRTC